MIEFRNLQELMDYIPNCIICKKEMVLSMEGRIARVKDNKKPKHWNDGGTWTMLKTRAKNELVHDDLLHFRNTKYHISIEPQRNKIIDGLDIAQRINIFNINKVCRTCDFKIQAMAESCGNSTHFPTTRLERETLNFTMRGGKMVRMYRSYRNLRAPGVPPKEVSTQIYINDHMLPDLPLEFSKIRDIGQLTRKIKTAVVFQ